MIARGHRDDPEIARLRDAIASDLIALRQTFGRRSSPAPAPGAEVQDQLSRILRGNPAWAAAAVAGAMAGLLLAVRKRFHGGSPD